MEIYNENMERIEKPDLEKGWLEDLNRTVQHAAVEAVDEVWHYEITAQYPNGGRDIRRVIDIPGVQAKAAWQEKIPIQIYHPYTAQELEERAQEAAKPTMEERINRMEAMIQTLSGMIEAAMRQWTDMLAAKGEE